MNASGQYRTLGIVLALGLAGLGSACNTMQTLIPGAYSSRTQAGVESHSGTTKESDKLVVLPLSAADLDCPIVEVEDGAAAVRVGGPANAEVRYQFDIGDTARECQPQGSNFSLKVGISGRLLIFQLVTDPILLPLTSKRLNDDYSIFIGFDNGHNAASERPRSHRKPAQTSSN
jgi:hypothetical protein